MDDVTGLLWRILAGPLCAAVVIVLLCRRSPFYADFSPVMERSGGAFIAILFLLGSTWFAWMALGAVGEGNIMTSPSYRFIDVGDLEVNVNWSLDRLSAMMALIVCVVSLLIFVYSVGYMHGDPGINRFFAKLSFFVFSMLGIVFSGNLVMMFIFWELVGVSSYLLIGYWYQRPAAAEAGKKAFIVNRIGDFGFLLGILLVWSVTNSVDFTDIRNCLKVHAHELNSGVLTLAALLIFCGAVGKSAQLPLHVWLPDAMEGPTPVSALIHAATMVAAGVYMLCRVSFLVFASPAAMDVIAWIGGLTALLSAVIACQQNDIKRILAYSTLSQLGYMVMAVGLSVPQVNGHMPAMFHLSTHAFFKALLFLSAGSVIIAFHHGEQDIWKMGGLWKRMPITTACFTVGLLALTGFPGLSGFYSKETILGLARERNEDLFLLATVTAGFTSLYMFRALFVAFLGQPRSETAGKVKESPWIVLGPLIVLAVLSVVAGYTWMGIPGWLVGEKGLSETPASHDVLLLAMLAFVMGLALAVALYLHGPAEDPVKARFPLLHRILWNKFGFDEFYLVLVKYVQGGVAALCDLVDRWLIAGLGVRGTAGVVHELGKMLQLFQTGSLQTYAFLFTAGLVIILYYVVTQ
jgi:NADH-quinone oxidoreductase subunit L